MKSFYDKDRDLTWIHYSSEESVLYDEYENYIQEINSWSYNQNVMKFISYNGDVGNVLREFQEKMNNGEIYFALRNNELVGVIFLSNNDFIAREQELSQYLRYQFYKNEPQEEYSIKNEKYLDFDDTFNILKNKGKSLYVEYLIVNPKYHGKGIGTAIPVSIKNNLDFFADKDNITLLEASIDNENIASRKAFLKSGFKKMVPCRKSICFTTYYCSLPHNKSQIEDKTLWKTTIL